jgi:hypothetical protein
LSQRLFIAGTGSAPPWVGILLAGGMVCWVLAPPAAFIRVRGVARLVSDSWLAERSAIIGWCRLVSMLGTALLVAVSVGQGYDIFRSRIFTVAVAAVVTTMIAFLLCRAIVLAGCVFDFRRAARIARASAGADGRTREGA